MRIALLPSPLLSLSLGACDAPPSHRPRPTEPPESMLSTDAWAATSDRDGLFEVEVEAGREVTAFQITGDSALYVSLEALYAPDGERVLYWEDWWYTPRSLTSALFGQTTVTALDWPVRDVDGPLQPGTWRAVMSLLDEEGYYAPQRDVAVSVSTKADPDFDDAGVRVRVVYADGVDGAPEVVEAVEAAVERWREVWGQVGLALEVRYVGSDLDPRMPWAYSGGDASVEAVSEDKDPGELQLVVGEQIRNSRYVYGVSANIPGTIEPTRSTYVALSWLVHAGTDAVFSDDEIRLMGETMAHEVGHYTGLFHPVESSYEYWDAIEDTPECDTQRRCEAALGTNLMFPYSICDGESCLVTDVLTDGQSAVMQRYLGAL